jgi:hypothetical protein
MEQHVQAFLNDFRTERIAPTPPGQLGYEGQPGNQGGSLRLRDSPAEAPGCPVVPSMFDLLIRSSK